MGMLRGMFFNKVPPAANFRTLHAGQPLLHPANREAYPHTLQNCGEGVFRLTVNVPQWRQMSRAVLDASGFANSDHPGTAILGEDGALTFRLHDQPLLVSETGLAFGVLGQKWIMSFSHDPQMRLYGLGEKHTGFEKTGQICKFWNTDVLADFGFRRAEHCETDPLYASIPYLLIKQPQGCLGILIDNPYPVFMNLAAEENIANLLDADEKQAPSLQIGAYDGTPDVYFILGQTPAEVTRKLQRLSGLTPLPPLWALGYHQCRFGYRDLADLEELDRKFDELEIPCDGLWLDIDYMDAYRVFTVNDGFEDHAERIARLQAKGRKVVPILDPGVKHEPGFDVFDSGQECDIYCKTCEAGIYSGFVWPGRTAFPDFSLERTQSWWAQQVMAFTQTYGFDGYWIDMNDPSTASSELEDMRFDDGREPHEAYHNQYALLMQQATLAGLELARPEQRAFVISRSGFISTQRFSALWTGDNWSNYRHLREGIAMSLNLSISGVPFNGPDVPGFAGEPSPALAIDWHKAGFLFPFFRNHSVKFSPPQEPWQFSAPVRDIIIHYIRLRYKLLPYLYQCFHRQARDGDPILQPLYYAFKDPQGRLDHVGDQFMVGEAIMQAPIVEEHTDSREITMPATGWFDTSSGQWQEGGGHIKRTMKDMDTGFFLREGHMIPMCPGEIRNASQARDLNTLEVHVILRKNSRETARLDYHSDDGISCPGTGHTSRFKLEAHADNGVLKVTFDTIEADQSPFVLSLILYDDFSSITLQGQGKNHTLSVTPCEVQLAGAPFPAAQSQPIELSTHGIVECCAPTSVSLSR